MKRICFVTTTASAMQLFIKPFIRYILENSKEYEITCICEENINLENSLPADVNYSPIQIKRGISISGVSTIFKLYKLFKKNEFDLVQYTEPNAAMYASISAWMAHVPVRLYAQWGMVFVGFRGVKRLVFKSIERVICRLSTWIEPDSKGNLDFCHDNKIYPLSKGSVIWNGSASGVNLNIFKISNKDNWREKIRKEIYHLPSDAVVYGFVGRVTGDKGINELFRAFKKILEEWSNAYLLLVGQIEKEDSLDSELLDWAKNNNNVIIAGYQTNVEEYLASMDIFILPSYREGFGSVIIEAEAMGLPVIVTNIIGPTEAMLNNETGLIVNKKDDKDLFDAMRKLGENKELRRKMGNVGHEFVKDNFNQEKFFSIMLKDREELIGKTKNRFAKKIQQ